MSLLPVIVMIRYRGAFSQKHLTRPYWTIQRSWFARVNALCNLSCQKSQEIAAHFRADF